MQAPRHPWDVHTPVTGSWFWYMALVPKGSVWKSSCSVLRSEFVQKLVQIAPGEEPSLPACPQTPALPRPHSVPTPGLCRCCCQLECPSHTSVSSPSSDGPPGAPVVSSQCAEGDLCAGPRSLGELRGPSGALGEPCRAYSPPLVTCSPELSAVSGVPQVHGFSFFWNTYAFPFLSMISHLCFPSSTACLEEFGVYDT